MTYEGISIFGDPVPFAGYGAFGGFGGATAMDTVCEFAHGSGAMAQPGETDVQNMCACKPGFVANQDSIWQCVAVAGEGGATPGGALPLPVDPVALAKQACTMAGLVWNDATATCMPAGTVIPGQPPPAPTPGPTPAPGAKQTELLVPLLVGSGLVLLGIVALSSKRMTANRRGKRRSR
jgi:hypothetical protein